MTIYKQVRIKFYYIILSSNPVFLNISQVKNCIHHFKTFKSIFTLY